MGVHKGFCHMSLSHSLWANFLNINFALNYKNEQQVESPKTEK